MKNIKKRLIGWTLGLALSLGVGIGIASNTHSEITGVEAAGETKTLIIDGSKLTSTATEGDSTLKYDDFDITFSKGAKFQTASGTNKFEGTKNAIFIGKTGTYIYNATPIGAKITKFEIYANKGASANVTVGVNFSAEKITKYNASSANTFIEKLSPVDHVYDASSKLPTDAKYFWYQVTNENNSQVMFRITYENVSRTAKSVTIDPFELNVTEGEIGYTKQLTATVAYNEATQTDNKVFWSSSNNDATISESGLLTLNSSSGSAVITATAEAKGSDGSTISSVLNVTWSNLVKVTAFEKYISTMDGEIQEGDYLLVYEGKAMKALVTSGRLQYDTVAINGNRITEFNKDIVWHISKSGQYVTIYNDSVKKFAASTGAKNKAQLLDDGANDMSLWETTGKESFEFVNKANKAKKVSSNLRNNGAYGFACYAAKTGGALSLYKLNKNLLSISIESPANKTTYYSGENFDPTGLVAVKHYDDNSSVTVPYLGNEKMFKFSPDLNVQLAVENKQIDITLEGKTIAQSIVVKPARQITGVVLNGDMDKKTYYVGDAWDVSGLYLTINWNEGEPTTVQLSDLDPVNGYDFNPKAPSLGATSVYITGYYAEKSFEGTITGLTVLEKSSLMLAYEAAQKLGLEGKTTVEYEFDGTVVGTIGTSFFVQDGDYGIMVYNGATVPDITIGKNINVKAILLAYKGMIETEGYTSATLGENAVLPEAKSISSLADLKSLKQNNLVNLEAVMPNTLDAWSSTEKSPLINLTVGADNITLKFDANAYDKSPISGSYSSLAGKKVMIKNAISSTFGSTETKQLLLTEQTTIEVIEEDNAKALAFGTSFLNATVAACTDGTKDNSEALKTAWATLKTEFNALSDGAKKLVKGAVANNAGTDLEKAMARYDHIVKRYSAVHTEIDDFIGRGVTTSLTNQLFKANTTNNIMVISLIACASVATIGGFFFIRKRKEQN